LTVLNYYQRNKDFLKEWEAEKPEDFYTLAYHSERLKKDIELAKSGNILKLWLFHKDDKDFTKTIGCINFSHIVRSILQSCILGYKLDKDEPNKGYITEALQKGIDIIFNEYKLHRIEAPIMSRNGASIRVVKKIRI
jgi:[ribosomal protein S5]-alanine N-acetyltransferase